MTEQHLQAPPPELVRQWLDNDCFPMVTGTFDLLSITRDRLDSVIAQAGQWFADQELEACIAWMAARYGNESHAIRLLRAARRPKPQTLNSIALQMLGTIERDAHYLPEITDTIRRALEQLND